MEPFSIIMAQLKVSIDENNSTYKEDLSELANYYF
jgi:hypothetical protein